MRQAQLRLGRFLGIRCEDYRSTVTVRSWMGRHPGDDPIQVSFIKSVSFPLQIDTWIPPPLDVVAKLRGGQLVEVPSMWCQEELQLAQAAWSYRDAFGRVSKPRTVVTVEKQIRAIRFDPEDINDMYPVGQAVRTAF